ncbi:response regulator, partial [Corallococcus exiguus]|uniref:response regulator n=1 Tax=Corallococcus exiguus TaxID=83462 RepID=UPI0015609172
MERRVLIVESQNDFALSMASVLKSAGYNTAMATTASDAQRELEKRRPDLVVVRAELPDQSGFALCGQIKKGKWGQNLKVLLLSSDSGVEGLNKHRETPAAADGYLVIPFEMGELASMSAGIVPPGSDDSDADLDAALSGAPREAPPPMPGVRTGAPPKLPKRERRSAMTDEDKAFMDRAFSSIADRKAELLAESRQLKRPPPRRELMGTPEGKVQILRDELKTREAQLARLSEIWSVRERELLSVEDRLHEKDVELQGLKMQVDDLLRRFNDAQQSIVQKEREHGATVDDLLLQKFSSEKDLIEVVASKEKDINVLRKEVNLRDEELSRRGADLESWRNEFDKLEKHLGVVTLEFEVKEQKLQDTVRANEADILQLRERGDQFESELSRTVSERDQRYAELDGELQALQERLTQTEQERDATVRGLEARSTTAEEHASRSDAEIERLNAERAALEQRLTQQVADLESDIARVTGERDQLRLDKDALEADLTQRVEERDGKISALDRELQETIARNENSEAELNATIQQHRERIGELEGEVEAVKTHLEDRENELTAEIQALQQAKDALEQDLTSQLEDLRAAKDALEADLNGQIQALTEQLDASQRQGEQLSARVASLEDTVAQRDGTIEGLQTDVADRDARISELTGNLEATSQQLTETQGTLSSTEATLSETRGELEATSQQLSETQGTLSNT